MWTSFYRTAALASLVAGSITWAQEGPAKHYHNKTSFRIPVVIDDAERKSLQEIQLWVRRLPGEWNCVATAAANQTSFTYQAPADGEYWFNVTTVDRSGKTTPPNPAQQEPALIVVVDTQAPNIEVKPAMQAGGSLHLQCRLLDANPDYGTVHLAVETADGSWQPLEAVPGNPGVFKWPNTVAPEGRVQVKAADKAGNSVEREVEVAFSRAEGKNTAPPPSPTLPAVLQDDPLRSVSGVRSIGETPHASETVPLPRPDSSPVVIPPPSSSASVSKKPTLATMPAAPPIVTGTMEGGPLPPRIVASDANLKSRNPGPLVSTHTAAHGPHTAIVNSLRCRLDFALDPVPGGISEIEVWASTDGGKNWKSVGVSPDGKSPATVEFPSEGKYSLAFVVRPAMGLASALPKPGEPPDGYIVVDTTLPSASLIDVKPGVGSEAGFLLISWKAEDAHLAEDSITFWYATQAGGPWQLISDRVANVGTYRWPLPKKIASPIWVRMEVRDRAGNVTRCETPLPVALEGPRARVRVLNVTPSRD